MDYKEAFYECLDCATFLIQQGEVDTALAFLNHVRNIMVFCDDVDSQIKKDLNTAEIHAFIMRWIKADTEDE